jgi:membrane-associated HD superfamily phosphohydrolase
MEDAVTTPPKQAENCPSCLTPANTEDAFCAKCGYPFQATEQEQNNFMSGRNMKEIDLDEAQKKIRRASNTLFFIGGATFLIGLIFYSINTEPAMKTSLLLTNAILGVIYTGLGFWCKKKPLAAIISGLSLYVLVMILNAVISPLTIVSGIIFKIIIIGLFINGIKSAIEAEKITKELNV